MTDNVLKPCPFCGSTPWLGTVLCGAPTAACNNPRCMLGGREVSAAAWSQRPIEDTLRAERDAALAEAARLREAITACAEYLPVHPEGAPLTPAEDDGEEVRLHLLAALRGEA